MKNKKLNIEDTVEKLRRTELLLEISRKIAGLKTLEEILWCLIDFVTKELGADRGTLFLNDQETNELYSRIAQGDLTREIRILNNVGIAGAIFMNQEGEIIHDVYKDSRFNKEVDQETGYKTKNMVCCPVKTVGGETIGVIQVLNKDLPHVIPHLTKLHQQKHNPHCAIQVDPVAIPLWYDKVIIQKGIKVTEANKRNGPQKKVYYTQDMTYLRNKWESGSRKLELLQCNPICVKQEYDLYGEFDTFHDFTYKLPFCGLTPNNEIEQKIKANLSRKIGIIRGEGSNSERELAAAFKHAGFQVYDLNMNDLIQDDHFLDNMNGIAFAGGFTFSDVLGAGTGWYSMIHYNQSLKEQFQRFYEREDSFSIGICNGCQLMAKLGWIDGVKDLELVENESRRFESRWTTVRVNKTNNIFLKSLAGLRFGIWVAHKEGQFKYNVKTVQNTSEKNTTETRSYEPVIQYIDSDCQPTQHYPENPNGSFKATAALSSKNGRHLAIMPHPERSFLMYQVPFTMLGSDGMLRNPTAVADHDIFYSPWFQMFLNL